MSKLPYYLGQKKTDILPIYPSSEFALTHTPAQYVEEYLRLNNLK